MDPVTYAEFQDLTLVHIEELHAYAQRLTGSRADAEDLVHNTYVRALRYWRQLRDPLSVRAWLFRILRGVFLNDRKRASLVPMLELVDGGEHLESAQCLAQPLDEAVLDRLLASEVEEALDHLPGISREIAVLADIWGFSYPEIAEILGCPIGTVRSRLHRARVRLGDLLESVARQHGYSRGASRSFQEERS